MSLRQINAYLPDDWLRVDDTCPTAFRPRRDNSGWLRIQVLPPDPDLDGRMDQALARLEEFAAARCRNHLGARLDAWIGDCTIGCLATARWRSSLFGLVQFWIIPVPSPGEAIIFASYEAGSMETAEHELQDAQAIVESLHFVDTAE